MLYLSKESPISSLLAGTLNPIKYAPTVLNHFAYHLPLITYKKGGSYEHQYTTKKEPQPPKGRKPSTTRVPTQTKERANLEHPDKEIKETTLLNPIEFLH